MYRFTGPVKHLPLDSAAIFRHQRPSACCLNLTDATLSASVTTQPIQSEGSVLFEPVETWSAHRLIFMCSAWPASGHDRGGCELPWRLQEHRNREGIQYRGPVMPGSLDSAATLRQQRRSACCLHLSDAILSPSVRHSQSILQDLRCFFFV